MLGDRAHTTDHPLAAQHLRAGVGKITVEVRKDQSPGWAAHVVQSGHGLLPAVATLGQVHCRADQADLVRQGLGIGVDSDLWQTRCDPQRVVGPPAVPRLVRVPADHLCADELPRSPGNVFARRAAAVLPGLGLAQSCELHGYQPRGVVLDDGAHRHPRDGQVHRLDRDIHQETHRVQVLVQRLGGRGGHDQPRRVAVVDDVQVVFDVAMRVEDERLRTGLGCDPLRGQRVQPTQPIPSGEPEHRTIVERHPAASGLQGLLFGKGVHTRLNVRAQRVCSSGCSCVSFMSFGVCCIKPLVRLAASQMTGTKRTSARVHDQGFAEHLAHRPGSAM